MLAYAAKPLDCVVPVNWKVPPAVHVLVPVKPEMVAPIPLALAVRMVPVAPNVKVFDALPAITELLPASNTPLMINGIVFALLPVVRLVSNCSVDPAAMLYPPLVCAAPE